MKEALVRDVTALESGISDRKMAPKDTVVFENIDSDAVTTAEGVATRLRAMIRNRELVQGDKLPPERDLAKTLGVSRPTLRSGIRTLTAVGILHSRQGAGTFVSDARESPRLDGTPLQMLSALNGFTDEEMFEAGVTIEMTLAGLAAERISDEQLNALADEVARMFASTSDPAAFRLHESRFEQMIAAATENRILGVLARMIRGILLEDKKGYGNGADLKISAERNNKVYLALLSRDAEAARQTTFDRLMAGYSDK